MKKEFNIGDRVRFKGDYIQYGEDAVSNGREYLITDVGYGSSEITLHCPVFIDNDDLELVEPCDPKTAFLSELKGLLGKYNAHLIAHKTDMPISVYFEGEDEPCVTIGKEVNKGCGIVITPDNIMDYDKE